MADTTHGTPAADVSTAARNTSSHTPDADPFDPCPGFAGLFSDINDSILAMHKLLDEAMPTDLSVVLIDALQLISLRCQIGLQLASGAQVEYTPTEIRILNPHTAQLCGF